MACCLFAAFLFAQCMAMLRRWGMFWGFVAVPEGEAVETVFSRLYAWLARPRVRMAGAALLTVELAMLGTWVYVEHRMHIVQASTATLAWLRGEPGEEGDMCLGGAADVQQVRLALADPAFQPGYREVEYPR